MFTHKTCRRYQHMNMFSETNTIFDKRIIRRETVWLFCYLMTPFQQHSVEWGEIIINVKSEKIWKRGGHNVVEVMSNVTGLKGKQWSVHTSRHNSIWNIRLCNLLALSLTGDWRKLHNEELRNLYSSPNIIRMIKSRRMKWAGHVARMGAKRNACRILVGKAEGKRTTRKTKT
jgi:hypothetical protein